MLTLFGEKYWQGLGYSLLLFNASEKHMGHRENHVGNRGSKHEYRLEP